MEDTSYASSSTLSDNALDVLEQNEVSLVSQFGASFDGSSSHGSPAVQDPESTDDASYASSATMSDDARESMEQNEVRLSKQLGNMHWKIITLNALNLESRLWNLNDVQFRDSRCYGRAIQEKKKTTYALDGSYSSWPDHNSNNAPVAILEPCSFPTLSEQYDIGGIRLVQSKSCGKEEIEQSIAGGNHAHSKHIPIRKWLRTSLNSDPGFGDITKLTAIEHTCITMPIYEAGSPGGQAETKNPIPEFKQNSTLNLISMPQKQLQEQPDYSNADGTCDESKQVDEMFIDRTSNSVATPESDPFSNLSFSISDKGQWPWNDNHGRMKGKDSYFKDGKRLIDFVLPYQPHIESKLRSDVHDETVRRRYRQQFIKSLKASGLQIEEETLCHAEDGKTCFIKIHATWEFLARNAELLQLQMPFYNVEQLQHKLEVMRFYIQSGGEEILPNDDVITTSNILGQAGNSVLDKIAMALNGGRHPFRIEQFAMPDTKSKQKARFNRRRLDMFDDASDDQRNNFFTVNQRAWLVHQILERTTLVKVTIDGRKEKRTKIELDHERVSFYQLLEHEVFKNPMVLHDDDNTYQIDKDPFENIPIKYLPYRRWLTDYWGSFAYPWRKFQPLDEIWHYFGVKTSLYFAWMGFYTTYLCLPAFVGTVSLIYGMYTAFTDEITGAYCDNNRAWANKTTCRLCPSLTCPYHLIWHDCVYARFTRVFDNEAAVLYAALTAVWAVVFLEKWKGRQAILVANWQAKIDSSDDVERAQYGRKAKQDTHIRIQRSQYANVRYHEHSVENPDKFPPHKNPWYKKRPYLIDPVTGGDNVRPSHAKSRVITSLLIVTFFLTMVICFMVAIVVYRIVGASIFWKLDRHFTKLMSPSMFTSVTASVGNAVVIYVGTVSYTAIAWKLTEYETHRTDGQFETSYTYKMFIFQFFNYFGSLLYLALLKGKLTETNPYYQRTYLAESCAFSGCLTHVSIQLIVIMIGKQVLNNVGEIGGPVVRNCFRKAIGKQSHNVSSGKRQWEKDFILNEVTKPYHFDDYLELVIQYGFIVMFAPAFPPAAMLAVLNNIIEVRIDGRKLLKDFRRPIPIQGDTIGAWMPILEILTKLAVVINGLVIASTTEFVDRTLYGMLSAGNTPEGYLDHVFSTFHTADYQFAADPIRKQLLRVDQSTNKTIEICIFRGYVHPHDALSPYLKNDMWWTSLLVKIIFAMTFEHLVFMVQIILQAAIPDIPVEVEQELKEARLQERRAIIFLDAQGGREEFAELSKKAAVIALRRRRMACAKMSKVKFCSNKTKNVTWKKKKPETVYETAEAPRNSRTSTTEQVIVDMDSTNDGKLSADYRKSICGRTVISGSTMRNKSGRNRSSLSKTRSATFIQSLSTIGGQSIWKVQADLHKMKQSI